MAIEITLLEKILKEKFKDDEIIINDIAGDSDHYEVIIKSTKFNGLTLLHQHRMVYDALSEYIGGQLHALKLKTIAK